MRFRNVFAVILIVLVSGVSLARDARDLVVSLRFDPQEGVDASAPDLKPSMVGQSVAVRVEDARDAADGQRIGRGTNDDDETFQIRSAVSPAGFLQQTIDQVLGDWGLQSRTPADRGLNVQVTKFWVEESNKAVGSTYSSEVELRCILVDGAGNKLAEVVTAGSANRYGRARSAENCNEVLSDALKVALADTLSDARLQDAWASGKPQSRSEGVKSIEERLSELDELLRKGVITKEEYDRKRAEILGEL